VGPSPYIKNPMLMSRSFRIKKASSGHDGKRTVSTGVPEAEGKRQNTENLPVVSSKGSSMNTDRFSRSRRKREKKREKGGERPIQQQKERLVVPRRASIQKRDESQSDVRKLPLCSLKSGYTPHIGRGE